MAKIFYLCLSLVIILGILPNYSKQSDAKVFKLNNGCLIYAIQYQYALEAQNILNDSQVWAKILLYRVEGANTGHAVTLYIYKNSTYVYDPANASYQLAQYPMYDPHKIVERLHPLDKVLWAEYAENVVLYNPF